MKETVLLTGGAGFIGSHIAVELLQRDYDVVIADDLSNSRPDVPERIEKITGRALAAGSRVILADEPTGSLDSDNGQMIVETLQRLAHQEERCVIVVTHDPKVAEAADIRLHMQDGKLSGEEA